MSIISGSLEYIIHMFLLFFLSQLSVTWSKKAISWIALPYSPCFCLNLYLMILNFFPPLPWYCGGWNMTRCLWRRQPKKEQEPQINAHDGRLLKYYIWRSHRKFIFSLRRWEEGQTFIGNCSWGSYVRKPCLQKWNGSALRKLKLCAQPHNPFDIWLFQGMLA